MTFYNTRAVIMSDGEWECVSELVPYGDKEIVVLATSEDIEDVIFCMNVMYDLPTPREVRIPSMTRLIQFKSIITEEIKELDNVIDIIELRPEDATVDYADVLVDLCVYCMSECMRHGIPWLQVYAAVMASNLSKLGADGKPIHDERGKFMKGPNYWPPEPLIKKILFEKEQA